MSGWLERTAAGIAVSIEHGVFTEGHSRQSAWLQGLDPRAKLFAFLVAALTTGLLHSLAVLLALQLAVLGAAAASRMPPALFLRRVWTGIPLFAAIVVVPSLFLGRPPLFALVFVVRVGDGVALALLLVVTTPWAELLAALHALRVPRAFVLVLAMTYRYVFLLLHLLSGRLEARRSRVVGRTRGREQRAWIAGGVVALLDRSLQLGEDVHAAMLARGFTGEVRTLRRFRLVRADGLAVAGCVIACSVALAAGRLLP